MGKLSCTQVIKLIARNVVAYLKLAACAAYAVSDRLWSTALMKTSNMHAARGLSESNGDISSNFANPEGNQTYIKGCLLAQDRQLNLAVG
jgi:hypothetical protein